MKAKNKLKYLRRIVEALEWVIQLEEGDFIEGQGHYKTHMQFRDGITQDDLDSICEVVNHALGEMHSPRRVANSMGELRPARVRRCN